MARLYEFPDPKDQSVNNPHRLVERDVVLALYNQANNSGSKNVSESVRSWFEKEAKKLSWISVQFVDQAAVLIATVKLA